MKDKEILIIGTGAQAKYALEIFHLTGRKVIGLISLSGERPLAALDDVPVLGTFEHLEDIYRKHKKSSLLFCCSKNKKKEELANRLEKQQPEYATAIHPAAMIARTAMVGHGAIINAGAVIQPFAKVGCHVMIHAGVVIEHDCIVMDYANLAPNVTLAGWVKVGKGATLYSGAVVIPNMEISDSAVVGAGGVVIDDIQRGMTAVGIPARPAHKD